MVENIYDAIYFTKTPYLCKMILSDKILTIFTADSTFFSWFVFNAKEKDYESGFHYYGSRYYSSELSIWNSTDPMADKYPSLTPYNYCANNPVKLIDPNGEEWDLSALTDEQQKEFNKGINSMCEWSPLFDEIYSTLTKSNVIYKPRIGKTSLNVPAEYNSDNNMITFANESNLGTANAFIEEFIHAYQLTENKNKYNSSLDFNYEFEAKVIKMLIMYENGGYPKIEGMEKLQNIIQNDYDFGLSLNYQSVTSQYFINNYISSANHYATYNKINSIGNINYHIPTSQNPISLFSLLQKVRP